MISFFRNVMGSRLGIVLAILFVGLIAVAFALSDIQTSGFFGGQTVSQGSLASVDGEEITETQVTNRLNRALQSARDQNPAIDMATLLREDGVREATERELRDLALRLFARDNGMAVSKRTVDGAIASVSAFQGLTGEFDEATFRQVLQAQNLTEQQVRDDLGGQALLQQILGPVGAAIRVTEALAQPYAALLLEERSGQVAQVPSRALPAGAPPTAAEISAFYQANLTRYTLPERRVVRFAIFARDQIEVPAPTEQQIRDYYQANAATYGGSQTRALRQVILPDEAAARAFAAEVQGGKSFEQAARERGFADAATVVGEPSQSEYAAQSSAAVAQAAFAAQQGALVGPVRSGLGWHVVRVVSVNQRAGRPLAAVRPEIVAALQQTNGEEAVVRYYEELQNQLTSGASFEEVASARGLEIRTTPPIDLQSVAAVAAQPGATPLDTPAPELNTIVQTAFTMEQDEEPLVQPLTEGQRYALVDLVSIQRSAPSPLNTIRDRVVGDFVLDRASTQARSIAATIVEKVNRGTPLAQAVREAGVALPAVQPASASRQAVAQGGPDVPPAVRMMFRMAANTAKLVRLPNAEGWHVVVLERIQSNAERVTPQMVQSVQAEFAQVSAREYADQFTNAVLARYEVVRDEEALTALAGRLSGTAP